MLNYYDIKKYKELIEGLISGKKFYELKKLVSDLPAVNLAEIADELDMSYVSILFRILPKELAAEVFVEMDPDMEEALLKSFTDKELAALFEELYLDDTVDIIEEMPANVVKRIIRNASKEDRETINQLLKYPKNTAGSVMTPEYVRLFPTMSVSEALAHIRSVAIQKETIYTCYVTDKDRHLTGLVSAKDLLVSSPDEKISSIMEEHVIYSKTDDDREDVAMRLKKHGFLALPVVDSEKRLVGIVTVDDAIDILAEEAEEDFAKMAAIIPSDMPYLKTPASKIWLARLPWLLLLMISATFSSAILSFFEGALIPVLVIFVPMLMDTGGNCGSQSSVTVIRALSTSEMKMSDITFALWKELRVGALCGVTLAAVAFGKIMLIDRLMLSNESVTVFVAAAVAATLFMTVVIAKIVGCSLPVLAKRLGFDPAVMASPFITTTVDVISLIVYFFIASSVFGLTV